MRAVVRVATTLLVTVGVVAAAGCSSQPATERAAPATSGPAPRLVGPEEFARRVEQPGVVTVNVHVPFEGDIPGTDLSIPFDQIRSSNELPTDKATPLAIYCRSDNMSATAVRDLAAMGYVDVVELDGGFNAWSASGRPMS